MRITNLANEPARPVQKPSYGRRKPTAKQRGNITPSVAKEVDIRSNGRCERCGKHESQVWGLQRAHLVRRWKLDKTNAWDVAKLCGPSVNSDTCHHWVDYTEQGREWAAEFREKLIQRYGGMTNAQVN